MQIDFEWFNMCVFFHINRRKCAAYVNSKTGHAQHKRCSLNQINQHRRGPFCKAHSHTYLRIYLSMNLFPKKWERKEEKKIYWLRGILRFDAIRLPNSFKIPFNPFVWLCKHSVKLNSTKPNETKRNPRRKGCPHSGRPADGARMRRERERKENQYAKPFFVLKNKTTTTKNIFRNKAQSKELKSWEKFARGILN